MRHQTVFAAGQKLDRIVLPETCVISLVIEMPEGRNVEAGMIGYEGAAGVGGAIGAEVSYSLQRIEAIGEAHEMNAPDLHKSLRDCPTFAARLHRFHDVLFAQSMQSTACVAVHPVEDRLARWLLEMVDRTGDPQLQFTHETLGFMVGATRTTVTSTLRTFERAGIVATKRGLVVVTDRSGLVGLACSCYRLTHEMYARCGMTFS